MPITEHTQYFNDDGLEVPSVTTIMKIINKPEIVEWANWLGFRKMKYNDVLEDSSIVGTYAHKMIQISCSALNVLDYKIIDDLDVSKQIKVCNCIDNFRKWRKEYKPKFIHNEYKLTGKYFGGTIDGICKIGDEKYIIDFKTSKAVYPSMFLQLAAYHLLIKECTNIDIDKVGIVRIDKKKKKYEFVTMNIYDLLAYEEVYIHLYRFFISWGRLVYKDFNSSII